MQRRRLFGGLAAALVLAVPALATQQQEPGGRPHQASSPAVRTIQPKQTLDRADEGTSAVAITSDRGTAVVADRVGRVRVLDVRTGETRKEIRVSERPIVGVAVSADDRRLLVLDEAGVLNAYDLKTMASVGRFQNGGSKVISFAPTFDGDIVVMGDEGGNVIQWAPMRDQVIARRQVHEGKPVLSVGVDNGGTMIVSASQASVAIHDHGLGKPVTEGERPPKFVKPAGGNPITTVAVSGDGGRLVVATSRDQGTELVAIEASSGNEISRRRMGELVEGLALQDDGSHVITTSRLRTKVMTVAPKMEEVAELVPPKKDGQLASRTSTAVSRDGKSIVTGGETGEKGSVAVYEW